VLVAMEEEGPHKVLQASEGSFDFPAAAIEIGEINGREGLTGQVSDEEFKMAVAKINADEAEIDVDAVNVMPEEVEILAMDKLIIAGRVSHILPGAGDRLMEGKVEGGIREIVFRGKAVGINVLAAQNEMNASPGQVRDIIEGAIEPVGGDDNGTGVFDAADEGEERCAFAVIIEIIDDEINVGIVKDIIQSFNAHLVVGVGAGLAPDHGVIVVKVIGDGEQGTVRSENAIALECLEMREAGHELVEEEREGVREDLLTADNESTLGRDVWGVAQLLREFTEDGAAAEAKNGLDHLREAEGAVAGEVRVGIDAEEGTYLIQGMNGLNECVTNLIGPC